jgi:hypothetical protein
MGVLIFLFPRPEFLHCGMVHAGFGYDVDLPLDKHHRGN